MRPSDGREAIIWREGVFRCELWTVNGQSELRIYHSETLRLVETPAPGTGHHRAHVLRRMALDQLRKPTTTES